MNGIDKSAKYLVDTNVLIYYFGNSIPVANTTIDELFGYRFSVSVITKIEFLGWAAFSDNKSNYKKAKEFLSHATIINLSDEIIEESISIRQQQKIKLPDCIIAASAIVSDSVLVTANTKDFKNLPIKFYNPMVV